MKRKHLYKIFFLLTGLFILLPLFIHAQNRTQTIRGNVIDKDTRSPLTGASIVILNSNPVRGATTDLNGNFRIDNVSVGRQSIKISFLGYQDYFISELEVVTGKEIVLNIEMTEKVITGKEVVITGNQAKNKAVNELSTVSARSFSVEETSKYAGSWGDPSRMVSNFAGVTIVSDKRNDIIVRGNSPIGVLWRMDGIEIPNPNHFAVAGSSGGAISMINNNLLDNSDFLTSAFAPEYGNAISAVFDLHMRNGNNEKHEYIAQVGVNGFEIGAEGPFSKKSKSSYLINYRYSTLAVLDKMGISIIDAVPKFQDLSFKLNFPLKKGDISVFGIGGRSMAEFKPDKDSLKWKSEDDQFGYNSGSQMGVVGITFMHLISPKTYLKIIYSFSANNPINKEDSTGYDYNVYETYKLSSTETKNIFSALINSKPNARNVLRGGVILKNIYVDNDSYLYDYLPAQSQHIINTYHGNLNLWQSYVQWKYNLRDNLSLNTGAHYLYLITNQKSSIEPRIALKWNVTPRHSFSIGYGILGQMQPTAIYLAKVSDSSGVTSMPNKKLDFTRSMHYVLGYDWQISENLHTKIEFYYQNIDKVPVNIDRPTISLLNFGTDDNIFVESTYKNIGKGKNYGTEATFEKFFSKSYYFLITASLFNSEYTGGDGVERDTRYNCNHAYNFLAGKEFKFGKNKNSIFGINTTVIDIGGQHYTPIDLAASQISGQAVYIDSLAYSGKFKDFFKIDFRIRFRFNSKRFSQEIAFEMNNILNRKNIESQYYDAFSKNIRYTYQLERIPIASYRIEF